jgi:hypothetical protein
MRGIARHPGIPRLFARIIVHGAAHIKPRDDETKKADIFEKNDPKNFC